ncbi:MAG: ubiquinol oxidase subunit II [Chlamydiales bacterium]
MKKKFTIALIVLLLLAVAALIVLYIATHPIAVMEPAGKIGKDQRDLFIIASLLMFIVVIPVLVMTLVFAWKYRSSNERAKFDPDWEHHRAAEITWWTVPFIIIIVLAVITWKTSYDLNPFKPIETNKKPLTIQVVALEWKWLFIYPEQGIAAVNFIQFPEQTPLRFEITAEAPMNSFWIPELGGQIYAMPAMRTELYLVADKTGTFRGCSANISGKGFAGMTFMAESSTQEAFDQWVESVKQSPLQLTLDEYDQLVKPSQYNAVTAYVLKQEDLFDRIIMKYEPPKK